MLRETAEYGSVSETVLYRQELDRLPRIRLAPEDEEVLKDRLLQGDESAREVVVTANLRLAMKIALGVRRKINFMDVVQAGNLGLVEAAGRYEYVKTGNFQYYAARAIRNKIFEHLYEQNLINVPPELQKLIKPFFQAEDYLMQNLFREPTLVEIAERADFSIDVAKDVAQLVYRSDILSLNVRYGNDRDEDFIVRIRERGQPDPAEQIVQSETREIYLFNDHLRRQRILKALAILYPRQREILLMQYGLADDVRRNFEDIARELNLTPQSVGETAKKAVDDLSTPTAEHAIFTTIVEATDEMDVEKMLRTHITNIHLRNVILNLYGDESFRTSIFDDRSILTIRENEVLRMYHEEHLMFREIGAALGGLSASTIRENYQTALDKLKGRVLTYLAQRK